MRWPTLTSRAIIGVDIGSRYIKAAQVVGSRITAAVWVPRTSSNGALEPSEVQRLSQALRKNLFRGKSIVLAVPATQILTAIMELPPRSSGAPIKQLACSELARRHNVDMRSLEIACWDLPPPARAANRTYVMAVACPQANAESLLDLVEGEGLNVEALDVQAMAVSRACLPLLSDVQHTGAILDVGWASSRLVLLHGGTVVYERDLTKSGFAAMVRLVASERNADVDATEHVFFTEGLENLGLPTGDPGPGTGSPGNGQGGSSTTTLAAHLENMAAEVRTSLAYLASQYQDALVKRLLMVGGGACIRGLQGFLAARLGLEVRIVNPGDLGQCPETINATYGPSLIPALGLAQYSWKAD